MGSSGLIETMDESLHQVPDLDREKKGEMEAKWSSPYPVWRQRRHQAYGKLRHGLLLKPMTCASFVLVVDSGAYTTSYSAAESNGFPPLKSYYI